MSSHAFERRHPDEAVDERATLTQRLDFLRATAVQKATGLSDEQAFDHPVPASTLTIGGLLNHLSGVERWWFSLDFARSDIDPPWEETDPDGGLTVQPGTHIADIIDEYVQECERSRSAIDGHPLDAMALGDDMHFNLRYALTHMIEETARHCGHLDLLRESIDGETGQ